jgi:threonyl-tRNA synthetase
MSIEIQRHDLAHILAMAATDMFPEAKLGIGPNTDNGFYYDFDLPRTLQPEDLPLLEKKMKKIMSQSIPFEKYETSIEDGINDLKNTQQTYKVELASDFKKKGETHISFYKNGSFIDMCKGPHLEHTGKSTKHFVLSSIAGAYWRGDMNRPMMQRIYGIAFETKEELEQYKEMIKEAKKRDHRVLGKKMNLFTFSDKIGPGLPLFTSKGTRIRNAIIGEIQKLQKKYGYGDSEVWIPHITKKDLYETSGHWEKFQEDLFHVKGKSDTEFVMKPMNCPHHTQIFDANNHSYRDLPLRITEVTTNYRDEQPGELLGLSRVRSLTQDDGHVFCMLSQVLDEAEKIVNIIKDFYTRLGMFGENNYWVSLSVRDSSDKDKYLGDSNNWDQAEKILEDVAKKANLSYKRIEGEAAFYGPKLDFMFKDALGREWQLATIQVDFIMPERFELSYIGEDGEKHTPIMIHRAIAGSIERFMSVIIEHFAGAFPLWLAPVHFVIIPVAQVHEEYAKELFDKWNNSYFIEYLDSTNSLGKRIRNSEMQRTPYMIVLGDKEIENKSITLRSYADKSQKELSISDFESYMEQEMKK